MRHLRQLLRYDVWANRETLDSLRKNAPARSLGDVPACGQYLEELSQIWPEYLDHAPDGSEPVPYTNSKGEAWTSTVEEVLPHVVIHSAYHRGKILG